MLRYLNGNQNNFKKKLEIILSQRKSNQINKSNIIKKIINDVKKNGDQALIKFEKKFSNIKTNKTSIKFSEKEIYKIAKNTNNELKKSIDIAYKRIKKFHDKQKLLSFKFKDKYKNELSYVYSPIDRVGVYVPGGTASYPSTVLMNCIPAVVAGVKNIFLTTPAFGKKCKSSNIICCKKMWCKRNL
ncbi:histidinol dehydrogenase [Pelagibacteraceae bacterium]|nr:histidinol dehydrogenase [Pelagibacteraceae bacterium]